MKHYKNGEFNKNYDRKQTVSSMTNFMKDPSGDPPWEEDDENGAITHVNEAQVIKA